MDTEYETSAEAKAKRRKIRKGTKSCWECKKRKMKCEYADSSSPSDTRAICIGCQQRGSKCVSQEFEFVGEGKNTGNIERKGKQDTRDKDKDRVARVEALVEELVKKVDSYGGLGVSATGEIPTPGTSQGIPTAAASTYQEPSSFLPLGNPSDDHRPVEYQGEYEELCRRLHGPLPSRQAIETICNSHGRKAILLHEMLKAPYAFLESNGLSSAENLLELPSSNTHPVLIARHMLYIAIFLQHLHIDILQARKGSLEPLPALMKRLAETAIKFVTTNDEFFGSLEALECVMIESAYHHNSGNLRRAWIANRRAMVIAQMMSLHQSESRAKYKVLDKRTNAHPQFMWFRIVSLDRNLCLMLGLTQGTFDQSMATGSAFRDDTPMGRLERIHCTLASRILERNESDPCAQDFALTQILDLELQKAGRSMPIKWWLMPNLDSVIDDPKALFFDMGRLFNQLYHYNLLNQLHLPYLLRSSPGRKHEYSRMACVNASREILSRFLKFRDYNSNSFCCRTVDLFALMGGITLLLAHLDGHRFPQTSNLLAHQYLSDRAMIEQAQVNMEQISRVNGDTLSAQSASLLHKLLAIDADTADGISTESVSVQRSEVRIERQGILSRETATEKSPQNNCQPYAPVFGAHNPEVSEPADCEFSFGRSDGKKFSRTMMEGNYNSIDNIGGPFTQLASAFQETLLNTPQQNFQNPGLAGKVDDWAFQGVDTALFDSIMRGFDEGDASEVWDNTS